MRRQLLDAANIHVHCYLHALDGRHDRNRDSLTTGWVGTTVTDDFQSDEHTLCNGCSVSTGNYVAMWQLFLRADYAFTAACGNIDGFWGSSTRNATKTYQALYGLSQDGIVGGNTWNAADNNLLRVDSTQIDYRGDTITPVLSKEGTGLAPYFLEYWNSGDGVIRFSDTVHPVNDMRKC